MNEMVPHSLVDVKNFGANAADADQLLKACFERHPVYEDLLNGESYVVLGRKGAGKTAIFQKLTEASDQQTFAAALSFSNYPWSHHKLQAEADVTPQLRYRASWRYLMLLTLASAIVEQFKAAPSHNNQKAYDATTALESFLLDTYGSTSPAFTTLFTPKRELKLSGTLGSEYFGKLSIDSITIEHLPVHFNEVNDAIEGAFLAAADPGTYYYVCFDELDVIFRPGDVEYAEQVTGLLLAARSLFLAARRADRGIRPVVFLRDDIFRAIDFEEKNKIDDDALVLHWEDDSAPVTLRTMMESRFREVLGTDTAPLVHWGDVFDEGELTRGQKPKYEYLLDRTLLRPRDVIKFCNEALIEYKRDRERGRLIGNSHLYAAKSGFSKYLLNEFRDEIHKHVPNYKKALDVLQRIGLETFAPKEFLRVASDTQDLSVAQAEELLKSLFEFSLVGLRRLGGASAGSGWSWKYRDPEALFAIDVRQARVHPGLKEALQLKEARDRGSK